MKFYVENPDLVQVRYYKDLRLLKYKRKVFYDNLWTPNLIECRGRVIDKYNNVVVNPFTKVFNYQENGTTIPENEIVLAVEKRNGFMAALTLYNGEWLFTSTGTFDSAFVELAKKYIKVPSIPIENVTFLFEVCAEEDPHIIKEDIGPYLIGVRTLEDTRDYTSSEKKEDWLDWVALNYGWLRPNYKMVRFGTLLEELKQVKHEGFCCYGSSGSLKLKSPYYLQTKAIARSNKFLALDEEFSNLLMDMPKDLNERERIEFIRSYFQ